MYAAQGIVIIVAASLCLNVNSESEDSGVAKDVLSIVDVFNRSEPLWHYQINSTATSAPTACMLLSKINISEKDYDSWRNESFPGGPRFSDRCRGIFEKDTRYCAVMNFSCIEAQDYEKGSPLYNEELMELIYAEATCSLFLVHSLVFSKGAPGCRLYVTDSAADDGPSETCKTKFNESCDGSTVVFYDKKCRQQNAKTRV
uniref:Putative group v salivary lipocalin n=1 Tax=Rhipicephalus pulchellus TaxID=72859 RepID=L7M8Q7_RHIPC